MSPDIDPASTLITVNVSPALGCISLSTVPAPVWPLQANGPSSSSGASLLTFTANRSLAIAYVAKDDCWKKAP
jgi:hypothetical protein